MTSLNEDKKSSVKLPEERAKLRKAKFEAELDATVKAAADQRKADGVGEFAVEEKPKAAKKAKKADAEVDAEAPIQGEIAEAE